MRIRFNTLALGALALLTLSATAYAGPITYTLSGSGASGTFNGVSFTNQTFVITGSADTANLTTATGFPAMLLTSATIKIGANPLATVTVSPYYLINIGTTFPNVLDFADVSTNVGVNAFTLAAGGTAWDLTSNFSSTIATSFSSTSTATDQGPVNFTFSSSTFSALTGTATPEPGTLALSCLGLIGLFVVRRRRV